MKKSLLTVYYLALLQLRRAHLVSAEGTLMQSRPICAPCLRAAGDGGLS